MGLSAYIQHLYSGVHVRVDQLELFLDLEPKSTIKNITSLEYQKTYSSVESYKFDYILIHEIFFREELQIQALQRK